MFPYFGNDDRTHNLLQNLFHLFLQLWTMASPCLTISNYLDHYSSNRTVHGEFKFRGLREGKHL